MSETYEKVLVKDDRIGCITSKVKYTVFKGGQNITAQPFKAISETTAAHTYNVTVPSLETIISREVLWQSTVTLKISNPTKDATEFCVNYGVTDALAPFPLHSLINTMTATINNNTVSVNMMDTLPLLLRMVDPEEFSKYDSMTPTALDYLANYRDGIKQMEFQLDAITDTGGTNPRPVVYAQGNTETLPTAGGTATGFGGTRPKSFWSYPNNVLAYDTMRPAGTAYYHKPRGSWKLKELYAVSNGTRRTPLPADTDVYATFEVTEPLLLSPFVFGSGFGKQGFYGIQTMQFQMNMTPTANRAWRSARFSGDKSASIVSFSNSQLLFQFLTPHPSDMLDPRNVVPYYELPIFRTTNLPLLPARPYSGQPTVTGSFNDSDLIALNSTNIQLTGIPDKLIICVRKPVATLKPYDADNYATIQRISINWNNQAGLLSSMNAQQLFRNSVQSGLANMSWDEFCGSTMSPTGTFDQSDYSDVRNVFSGQGANLSLGNGIANCGNTGVQMIPTTGTILVLNFAEVIQLTEEYYAPGSMGTFNLQMTVYAQNNTYTDWQPNSYELIIMPMFSGVFVNERGTSSTFQYLLTKQDVLDSLGQQPYSNYEVRRMVGGGFLDNVRSALGWIRSKLPEAKGVLQKFENPYAQTGAKVLDALGYGKGHKAIDNRLA